MPAGLTKDDFVVYEDNKPVEVTHFNADRTPVSLGIVLDTSGSMEGEKWSPARERDRPVLPAMNDEHDEFFLYRFSGGADLVADWTNDRDALSRRARPHSSRTAARRCTTRWLRRCRWRTSGRNRKKAVVIISDGNDTSSRVGVGEVQQLVRETRSAGLRGRHRRRGRADVSSGRGRRCSGGPRMPIPFPFPAAADAAAAAARCRRSPAAAAAAASTGGGGADDRVNVMALREITDDSGGRTEIVRDPRDLDPATASIADELSQQSYLGYPSPGHKDGRWHTIRVEVSDPCACACARAAATSRRPDIWRPRCTVHRTLPGMTFAVVVFERVCT